MCTFRHKPLPKTDTLLTIQLQTYYYKVAILLVNISMFGYHNTLKEGHLNNRGRDTLKEGKRLGMRLAVLLDFTVKLGLVVFEENQPCSETPGNPVPTILTYFTALLDLRPVERQNATGGAETLASLLTSFSSFLLPLTILCITARGTECIPST